MTTTKKSIRERMEDYKQHGIGDNQLHEDVINELGEDAYMEFMKGVAGYHAQRFEDIKSGEKYHEKCYKVTVVWSDRSFGVNVFTESEDDYIIKELGKQRAVEYLTELGYIQGYDFHDDELKPVGYKIEPQFEV